MKKTFIRPLITLVIVSAILAAIGVGYTQMSISQAQTRAEEFCKTIQAGKTVDEVMQQVGVSSFDNLIFTNSAGEVVNAANRGTFSPSKSAGFTTGKMEVRFQSKTSAFTDCVVEVTELKVTSTQVRQYTP
ncbi:hypothetical protein ACLVWU_07430 [Bdellovibrio sp. HCB290]|uniref:hypothetical protein n=1 Tax=Bdellovibrio sp. HCB290 TaxID=3394356 RepID=UPI0039B5D76E